MERRGIAIRGTVQGVGFRPFVHQLASRLALRGFVRNDGGGVRIEIEGDHGGINQFLERVRRDAPPLARIQELEQEPLAPRGEAGFRIEPSRAGSNAVVISPDAAVCDRCLAELFDPSDRRYRYPFLNCTDCGPRLTIVTGAPYDRARTTMARFRMCARCRAEYENPADRRFHAQPIACPECGPRLRVADARGEPIESDDPLRTITDALRSGRIAAIKGLGGYHLACDAGNSQATAELRRRKHREEKPFAVMARDEIAAAELCEINPAERELLLSPARPIVLLRRRPDAAIADAVSPQSAFLGVMLPYAPLHHLLLHDLNGMPLVMTSGNRSDEPIAIDEPAVFDRLAGIADLYLTHDRPIHVRCDDSVTRIGPTGEMPIRRSRGFAPAPIVTRIECPEPGIAVGGQLKGTFALLADGQATLSHHLGDLDHLAAYEAFERDLTLYERLFQICPRWIACDLHPEYASTHYARARAEREGLRLIPVQHHHAHMASCLAEHGADGPVIGVSFDGTGFGTDGAIWGGEFLVGDATSFRRAAHLRYVPLPGGDAAVREPWRMAIAHLTDAGADCPSLEARLEPAAVRTVRRMIERGFHSPPTSSAGRLFDAVASMLGVRDRASFEGQAAVLLERLATESQADEPYPFEIGSAAKEGPLPIDVRPMIRAIAAEVASGAPPADAARRFHATIAEMIVRVCLEIRSRTGISTVALSGGVFLNVLLCSETSAGLERNGFSALWHRHVPANDGGLSLGQLAVAARAVAAGR